MLRNGALAVRIGAFETGAGCAGVRPAWRGPHGPHPLDEQAARILRPFPTAPVQTAVRPPSAAMTAPVM